MPIEWPDLITGFLAGAIMAASALLLPYSAQPLLKLSVIVLVYVAALTLLSKDRLVDAGRTLQECIHVILIPCTFRYNDRGIERCPFSAQHYSCCSSWEVLRSCLSPILRTG